MQPKSSTSNSFECVSTLEATFGANKAKARIWPGLPYICHVSSSTARPGGNPEANLEAISHRCYLREVAFEWELTKETICLPLGCLRGSMRDYRALGHFRAKRRHTTENVSDTCQKNPKNKVRNLCLKAKATTTANSWP